MTTAMPLGFGAGWTVRPEFSGLTKPPEPSGAWPGQSGSLGGAAGSAEKTESPEMLKTTAKSAGRDFQRGCTPPIEPESELKGNLEMRLVIEIPAAAIGLGVFHELGVPLAGGVAIGEQNVGSAIVALLRGFAANGQKE